MRNADLLARMGAVSMAVAAAWNVVAAYAWVVSLGWLVVGLFWLVPLCLALLQLGYAALVVAGGHRRGAFLVPLVGIFVSLCNLNFLALMLEFVDLVLFAGAAVAHAAED